MVESTSRLRASWGHILRHDRLSVSQDACSTTDFAGKLPHYSILSWSQSGGALHDREGHEPKRFRVRQVSGGFRRMSDWSTDQRCPLYPQKQTCSSSASMSAAPQADV